MGAWRAAATDDLTEVTAVHGQAVMLPSDCRLLATQSITTATANPDGYTAREVLAHPICRAQLGDR